MCQKIFLSSPPPAPLFLKEKYFFNKLLNYGLNPRSGEVEGAEGGSVGRGGGVGEGKDREGRDGKKEEKCRRKEK